MWGKLIAVATLLYAAVYGCYRRHLTALGERCLRQPEDQDWKHGDVLIVANRSIRRTLQFMLLRPLGWALTGTAFVHPLLVLERQGRKYVLHFYKEPYTPEGEPLCPRMQTAATRTGVYVSLLDDFLRRQAVAYDVVLEVWRSPTFPASTQTYDAVLAKANRACGQPFSVLPGVLPGLHCIAFMAILLHQLGYFGHLSSQEVLAQATPGSFQRLLESSSFRRIHTWCA